MKNHLKMMTGVTVLVAISMSLEAAIEIPQPNTSERPIASIHFNNRQLTIKATHTPRKNADRRNEQISARPLIKEAMQPNYSSSNELTFVTDIVFITQEYEMAEEVQQLTLNPDKSVPRLDDLQKAVILDQLSTLNEAQNHFQKAESQLQMSLELREIALGSSHLLVAVSLNNLASLAIRQKRPTVAEPLLKRSLNIVREISGPQHANSATMLTNLADVYQSEARLDEAETLYKEAISIWVDSPGDPRRRAIGQNSLGRLLLSQGRFDDARVQFEQILTLLKQNYTHDHPYVQQATKNLGALQTTHQGSSKGEPFSDEVVMGFGFQLPVSTLLTAKAGAPSSGLLLKLF